MIRCQTIMSVTNLEFRRGRQEVDCLTVVGRGFARAALDFAGVYGYGQPFADLNIPGPQTIRFSESIFATPVLEHYARIGVSWLHVMDIHQLILHFLILYIIPGDFI